MARSLNLRRLALSAACTLAVGATAAVAGASSSQGMVETYQYPLPQQAGQGDQRALAAALEAARSGDGPRIRAAMSEITDPLSHEIALWALIDVDPSSLGFSELEAARRDLAGWPHPERRLAASERALASSGLSPTAIVAWFGGAKPVTPEGMLALAGAQQALGQAAQAAATVRAAWTGMTFDSALQQQFLERFGSLLTAEDHARREDMLLYGRDTAAARDLMPFLDGDQRALAEARLALREGASDAETLVGAVPPALRGDAGLAFEQTAADLRRGEEAAALAEVPRLDHGVADEGAQQRIWKVRKELVVDALEAGDARAAYRAASQSGVDRGPDGAEAEFYAGWIALTRLKDPRLADEHFAKLQEIGGSPITESRALYWRGRAAEAMADPMGATVFYAGAARWQTAFYGQLAAAKIDEKQLDPGRDPPITAADRTRFETETAVRAARRIADIGARETFRSFVAGLAEEADSDVQAAQLVDFARSFGDQSLAMKVVRTAAQHGFILPERGYPVRLAPGAGGVEPAFVLGIVRQESGFDPSVRSPAGARGMMQLMPSTASIVARQLGYSYDTERLEDADFNMQLGSAYLGQLVQRFGGSYLMAAAAYNAGPGRPAEWTSFCGDPRASTTDPADFIECIPISETRNYVMRVLEATEVYRARLAGGAAKVSLASDLKRGGWGYGGSGALTAASVSDNLR